MIRYSSCYFDLIVISCHVTQVSLANSGHFADSEGDQGDAEAEEEESLGGDERSLSSSSLS